MVNELLLTTGCDIPFAEAQITIHQPTLKEIGMIGGDEVFFIGSDMLNFSKDILSTEDKTHLENMSDFEVFMSIIKDKKNLALQRKSVCALLLMTLMFPEYQIKLRKKDISFEKEGEDTHYLNSDNFKAFKDIVVQMYQLKEHGGAEDYNPAGAQAKAIAEKLKKGRQKVAEQKNQADTISVFSRYMSILAVGTQKSLIEVSQYTVYQLFEEFKRFELKNSWDIYFKLKIAGAKDVKEVDDWMKDIHSDSK
jgi:hypothetical protein